MEYKLLPGPNKMLPKVVFAASNAELFKPTERILDIRRRESFKKGDAFNLDDCHEFIDFFKQSISKYDSWAGFGFTFTPTAEYKDISGFYREVAEQGYTLRFQPLPAAYVDGLVENGCLYLSRSITRISRRSVTARPICTRCISACCLTSAISRMSFIS